VDACLERGASTLPLRLLTNLQAHVERVPQTIKHEVLNAFGIVTNEHRDGILRTTQDWYNARRGHSERDHLPPLRDEVSVPLKPFIKDQVVCDSELGGNSISCRRAT